MNKNLDHDPLAIPKSGDLDVLLRGVTQEDRIRIAREEVERLSQLPRDFETCRRIYVLSHWGMWAEHLLNWSKSDEGKKVSQQSLTEWGRMMGSLKDGLDSD